MSLEKVECPICGKKFDPRGMIGHLAQRHDKEPTISESEVIEKLKNGNLDLQGDFVDKSGDEEVSRTMESNGSDYLKEITNNLESQEGYYKEQETQQGNHGQKDGEDNKGSDSFFSNIPGFVSSKWGKRLALAALASGAFVLVTKNWERISNSLSKDNETKNQNGEGKRVSPGELNDKGKNNGKEKPKSGKTFARRSDL